jgi:hypothetical protein
MPTLHEPVKPARPRAHAARLAETATRLLPRAERHAGGR